MLNRELIFDRLVNGISNQNKKNIQARHEIVNRFHELLKKAIEGCENAIKFLPDEQEKMKIAQRLANINEIKSQEDLSNIFDAFSEMKKIQGNIGQSLQYKLEQLNSERDAALEAAKDAVPPLKAELDPKLQKEFSPDKIAAKHLKELIEKKSNDVETQDQIIKLKTFIKNYNEYQQVKSAMSSLTDNFTFLKNELKSLQDMQEILSTDDLQKPEFKDGLSLLEQFKFDKDIELKLQKFEERLKVLQNAEFVPTPGLDKKEQNSNESAFQNAVKLAVLRYNELLDKLQNDLKKCFNKKFIKETAMNYKVSQEQLQTRSHDIDVFLDEQNQELSRVTQLPGVQIKNTHGMSQAVIFSQLGLISAHRARASIMPQQYIILNPRKMKQDADNLRELASLRGRAPVLDASSQHAAPLHQPEPPKQTLPPHEIKLEQPSQTVHTVTIHRRAKPGIQADNKDNVGIGEEMEVASLPPSVDTSPRPRSRVQTDNPPTPGLGTVRSG